MISYSGEVGSSLMSFTLFSSLPDGCTVVGASYYCNVLQMSVDGYKKIADTQMSEPSVKMS